MLNELTNLVNKVNFLLTYMSIENDIVSNNNNQCLILGFLLDSSVYPINAVLQLVKSTFNNTYVLIEN